MGAAGPDRRARASHRFDDLGDGGWRDTWVLDLPDMAVSIELLFEAGTPPDDVTAARSIVGSIGVARMAGSNIAELIFTLDRTWAAA